MRSVKYAIVIVTYNRAQLLRESVEQAVNQTICPTSIIIVNNASTDDTGAYLKSLALQNFVDVINLPQNIGGAGGFAKGIELALKKDVDCVLVIDDDALIANDYMEKILAARELYPRYRAFAGIIKTEGKIDTIHRRNLLRAGLLSRGVPEEEYKKNYFICDIASFCGMVIDTDLIRRIGIPHAEYFIFCDDTEYSLRIRHYSKFLVVTDAELHHKKEMGVQNRPRRYDWKDYYSIRNRILMVKEHGNTIDMAVNFIDIFIHAIFRNWLFGVIKRDHYDWRYESCLVRAAVRSAVDGNLQNVIMKREEQEKYHIEYSGIHKGTV